MRMTSAVNRIVPITPPTIDPTSSPRSMGSTPALMLLGGLELPSVGALLLAAVNLVLVVVDSMSVISAVIVVVEAPSVLMRNCVTAAIDDVSVVVCRDSVIGESVSEALVVMSG